MRPPRRAPGGERAHQLVADRAGRAGHFVDRHGAPPELHLGTDVGTGHRREIHGEHVHRDPADDPRADPGDGDRRARRRVAGIAVRVAAGDDADAHGPRRGEDRTVADGVAGLQALDRDQPRGERHGRLELQRRGASIRERARTVQHDARPHPVAARFGNVDQGGRVGQRPVTRQAEARLPEALQRGVRSTADVRVREVRHQRRAGHGRQRAQACVCPPEGVREEAQPVHPAVELEVDRNARGRPPRLEPAQLLLAVNRELESEGLCRVEVGGFEGAFEHQDRPLPAALPQPPRVVELDERQAVGAEEPAQRPRQPVAVGVGLDDRPDPGIRRMVPDAPEVVPHCSNRNRGLRWSGHALGPDRPGTIPARFADSRPRGPGAVRTGCGGATTRGRAGRRP